MKPLFVAVLAIVGFSRGSVIPSAESNALPTEGVTTTPESSLEQRCRKFGGEGAFERRMKSDNEFKVCMSNIGGSWLPGPEIAAMNTDDAAELIKSYCNRSSAVETCLHNLQNGSDVCTDPELMPYSLLLLRMVDGAIDYVCHDDGRRIITYLPAYNCTREKVRALDECLDLSPGIREVKEWGQRTMFQTEESCRNMSDLRDCIVDVLGTCPQQVLPVEAKGFLDMLYAMLPCAERSASATSI